MKLAFTKVFFLSLLVLACEQETSNPCCNSTINKNTSTYRFWINVDQKPARRGRITVALTDGPKSFFINAQGFADAEIPEGQYDAIASLGPFHSREIRTLNVTSSQPRELTFNLRREVDTSGFLSADFHQHAWPSPDSELSYETRVILNRAEDLDLVAATDHNFIGKYPDELMPSIQGMEYTTALDYHFNAFPLRVDPALKPETTPIGNSPKPEKAIEYLRRQGDKSTIIQVNHPLSAVNSFDILANAHLDFDAVEIYNGGYQVDPREAIAIWFALLKKGKRVLATGNSDSHRTSDVIGYPRNMLSTEGQRWTENPNEVISALKSQGNSVVTSGPMIRLTASTSNSQRYPVGSQIRIHQETLVHFYVEIQSASWIQLTSMKLLINGEVEHQIDLRSFTGPVRKNWKISKMLRPGSFAVVSVEGSGQILPFGSSPLSPFAITNPIYFR